MQSHVDTIKVCRSVRQVITDVRRYTTLPNISAGNMRMWCAVLAEGVLMCFVDIGAVLLQHDMTDIYSA